MTEAQSHSDFVLVNIFKHLLRNHWAKQSQTSWDPWDGGTNVCSNDRGHMTKVAAKPIYSKNFKIFFRTEWPRSLKLGLQHWALEYYQVCSVDNPRFPFDLFTQKSPLVPYASV